MTQSVEKFKWSDENVAALQAAVVVGEVVAYAKVEELAETIGTSSRSIGAKLRSLGYEVAKKGVAASTFTADETAELQAFIEGNKGAFTFGDIAEKFAEGKFTAKQIQGKVLALELNEFVKPTVHEKVSKYSPEAEAQLIKMANEGASIEAIATALNAEVKSVRGKALSLLKSEAIAKIPHSEVAPKSSEKVDVFAGLDVEKLTVAELAAKTEKTERGIKAMLTRRDIACKDYAPKRKAVEEKAAA